MSKEIHNRYREEEKAEQEMAQENQDLEQESKEEVAQEQDNETKSEIETLKEEVEKYKNQYLRTLAEMENFKKRFNEERVKERKYAHQGLLEKLVNIVDIFDKAVNIKTDDQKLQNFLTGFVMINDSFKKILESEEVKKIEALGKEFDPK